MSDFISLAGRTAEEFRADARAAHQRSADSFERSDTDGFLSQWASDTMARAYELAAEILDAGSVWEFFGVRDMATGVLIPGKWIETQYGGKFAIFESDDYAMTGKVRYWTAGTDRALNAKGLETVRVRRVVAGLRSHGNGMSVSYHPVPAEFSPNDIVVGPWAAQESEIETVTVSDIRVNDIVRIGKGKARWAVTEISATGALTLVSEKGQTRIVPNAEGLTVIESAPVQTEQATSADDSEKHDAHVRDAQDIGIQNWIDACLARENSATDSESLAAAEQWKTPALVEGEVLTISAHAPGDRELTEWERDALALADSAPLDDTDTDEIESDHVDYPHTHGYLGMCPACESGPCMCNEPCNDPECDHAPGAKFEHLAPCVSDNCEHPDSFPDMERCPACGDPIDYCQGHGPIGDPEGHAILMASEFADDNTAPVMSADELDALVIEMNADRNTAPAPSAPSDEISAPEDTETPGSPNSSPSVAVSGWERRPIPAPNRAQRRAMKKRQGKGNRPGPSDSVQSAIADLFRNL